MAVAASRFMYGSLQIRVALFLASAHIFGTVHCFCILLVLSGVLGPPPSFGLSLFFFEPPTTALLYARGTWHLVFVAF